MILFCQDGQIVGIGSGSTIEYAIKRLGNDVCTTSFCVLPTSYWFSFLDEKASSENLKIICIPSSYQVRTTSDFVDQAHPFKLFKTL